MKGSPLDLSNVLPQYTTWTTVYIHLLGKEWKTVTKMQYSI